MIHNDHFHVFPPREGRGDGVIVFENVPFYRSSSDINDGQPKFDAIAIDAHRLDNFDFEEIEETPETAGLPLPKTTPTVE